MRLTLVLLVVCVYLYVGSADAWWGGGRSSKSSSSSNSKSNGNGGSAKPEKKSFGTRVRETVSKAVSYVKDKVKSFSSPKKSNTNKPSTSNTETGDARLGTKISNAADFVKGAVQGAAAMGKAYKDMHDANWKNSDKYFHSRGNADAAKHGPGGKWAAEKISNAREWVDQNIKGDTAADSAADQAANKWGREGGDPNKYRPKGLPKEFR